MSGLAGVYHLDGRPMDAVALHSMLDALAHRGPDGEGQWIDGAIGLGHRLLYTTPQTRGEPQPFVDPAAELGIALDGRVDNREELLRALGRTGERCRGSGDAELILRAYQRWAELCLARIVGDYAFVLWDGRRRRLFCARDPLGMKPFYYYHDGRVFRWASELRPLLLDAAVSRRPNEGMIAEYLACAITHTEETLYQRISRLPPAHYLLVGPGYLRKQRYWGLDAGKRIRYRRDAEYAEHFREILEEAVRCRLRSHGPLGAHLSGGLDSSSVTAVVQDLYRRGAADDQGFEVFSQVYPGLPCDESTYIQDVVQMWGLRSNLVAPSVPTADHYLAEARQHLDFPDYPNGGAAIGPLNALARAKGFRVLLTGLGGNLWLESRAEHLADLLRQGRLGACLRQARADASLAAGVSTEALLVRFALGPLVPPVVRATWQRLRGRDGVPRWVDERLARRVDLRQRLRGEAGPTFASYAQRALYEGATGGSQVHGDEMNERLVARYGIEERHPLNDRRLVEFALALPERQRYRGAQAKFILRQAMQGRLPAAVYQRRVQADFSVLFVQAFAALGAERLFGALAVVSLGWVHGDQVRTMYDQMTRLYDNGDPGYAIHVWPLWMVCGIELWLRAVFSLGAGAGPLRPLP